MKVIDMYRAVENTPDWGKSTEAMLHVFDHVLMDMKEYDHDMYCDVKMDLYTAVNGYHFNKELLHEAVEHMENDNGTISPKWSVEETTQVGKNAGIMFVGFNEYDWNYVMNMVYSDYCEVLGDNVASYIKIAEKFIHDKDAPDGKPLRYYMCMKYAN